jgi:hypothetical protein
MPSHKIESDVKGRADLDFALIIVSIAISEDRISLHTAHFGRWAIRGTADGIHP